jgi:hypothetical protein
MKFQLTITLGNDAMQSPKDIANALREAAYRVTKDDPFSTDPIEEGESGLIKDENGNTVGKWAVVS